MDPSELIFCRLHDRLVEIKTGGYLKGDMVISFYGMSDASVIDAPFGALQIIGGVKYSISGCQDKTFLPTTLPFDEERIW